jgi:hypothetical protein
MNKVDRNALKRAIALACAESPERAHQIRSMLKTQPWKEVATFAAECCQSRFLRLKPWQDPPCDVDSDAIPNSDGIGETAEAQALLQRMLRVGLSRWEPDPLAALAKVEAAERGAVKRTAS